MLQSNYFQETTITINGNQYKMDYDLATAKSGAVRAFGNIYVDSMKPIPFTFFTINNKIAAYTPKKEPKEFIGNVVSAVLGEDLPFYE